MYVDMPDLMTFLYNEFVSYKERQRQKAIDDGLDGIILPLVLDDFIAFARKYLAQENQPLNVTYLNMGLGLRLQQGQIVCFVPQHAVDAPLDTNSVPITRPQTIPGMHGIVNTGSVPIFGKS